MRVLSVLILFFLCAILGFSQSHEFNNAIKINPFGAVASAIPVKYERMLFHQNASAQLGVTYIYNKSGTGQNTYNNDGIIVNPELRYFFYKDSIFPSKIYVSAFYNYETYSNTTKDRLDNLVKGKSTGNGVGLLLGNQWAIRNRLIIDMYVGPAYMQYVNTEEYELNIEKGGFLTSFTAPKNTGVKVKLGLIVGFSF